MKILFISYFFDPFPGVGAKRISYWADEISKHGIEPTVITSVKQNIVRDYSVYYVPNSNKKRALSKFIKDEGYSWELDLIDFFNKSDLPHFDFILISGGPFMHMGISRYLKKLFSPVKLILDFRDPFAINPRFNEYYIKTVLKKYFEKRFLKNSDGVITVNHYCEKLLQTNKNITVIENGFDERVINFTPANRTNKKFIIAHAGSLYSDRDPRIFLEVLSKGFADKIVFHQYGNDTQLFDKYRNSSFLKYKGKHPYKDLIEYLKDSDACILFTLGKAFESTTKIFDYLALNKKVLIITEGRLKTGNLHEITKDYPNVIWANNNELSIKEAILNLKKMETKYFDASKFSRKNSLVQLVNLLKSI